jgi:hypothetical protein
MKATYLAGCASQIAMTILPFQGVGLTGIKGESKRTYCGIGGANKQT